MPTFVAEYGDAWSDATSPKSASVTVASGDALVVIGVVSDQGATLATPTGGGLTYTLQQSVVVSAYCAVYVWTALPASSQTFTLSVSRAAGDNTLPWGFSALRFSSAASTGASSKTNVSSGAPSLGLTTGSANSTIVAVNADWNATDGTARTWRTINSVTPSAGNSLETTYFRDASAYTVYVAYYNDAGAAGAKTTGLSAPSGQKYAIVAVEIVGAAGGGSQTMVPTGISSAEAHGSPTVTTAATLQPGSIASGEAFGTPTLSQSGAGQVMTPTGISSLEAFGAVVVVAAAGVAPTGITSAEAFGTPTLVASTGVVLIPVGISSGEAFGLPALVMSGLAWRLVHPRIEYRHRFQGNLTVANTVELSVYGDDSGLVTHQDGDPIPPDAQYVWRGGYLNTTDNPAIRDLWLANGYEVEAV
ncbi:hypothetical protein [Lentzea sp. E54]|uniref:hypothetical protein n=1 Tax=Lentzea xerophila TaxID=3435883 RepID=UPI003DA1EF16